MGTRRHRKKLRGGEAIFERQFHLQVDNLMKQNMKLTRDQAEDMVFAKHVQRAVKQEVPPNVILGNLVQEGPVNMGYDKWSSEIKKYKNLIRPFELLSFQSRVKQTPYYKKSDKRSQEKLDFLFMKDVPDDGSIIHKPFFDTPRATPEQMKAHAKFIADQAKYDAYIKQLEASENQQRAELAARKNARESFNPAALPPPPSADVTEQDERQFAKQKQVLAQQQANLPPPPKPPIFGDVRNLFRGQGGRKSLRNNKMHGARRTRRHRARRGGDGFDPSTAEGKESSFAKGKRRQEEAEARRVGEIASAKKKVVSAALIKGLFGKGRRSRRRHTRRRR